MGTGKGTEKIDETSKEAVLATVSLRKTYAKRLVNYIASLNSTEVIEKDDAFIISAPFIKVSRLEVEGITGKISDAKWRMMFVNRIGDVREFSNEKFIIGTPNLVIPQDNSKEMIQTNIKIEKTTKDEMEKYRAKEYLGLTQNEFVEQALLEFIAYIKKELL